MYVCGVCGDEIVPAEHGDPHTDPATGEDVHEWHCSFCHRELRDEDSGD